MDIKDKIACYSLSGMPPIINPSLLAMIAEKKEMIGDHIRSHAVFLHAFTSPLLLGGLWLLVVTFAIKRDIKLASIVGGSIAGFCYLFSLCDYLVRNKIIGDTKAVENAFNDTLILTGCLETGGISTLIGCVSIECLEKCNLIEKE